MNIKQYLNLSAKRNNYRVAARKLINSNGIDLIEEYKKEINKVVEQKTKSGIITGSDFRLLVNEFSEDLVKSVESIKSETAKEFEILYNNLKNSLDISYKIDTALIPQVYDPQRERIINEIQSIVTEYRNNRISENTMKRLIARRIEKPTYVASTLANTQIAGWDNTNNRTIAELAFIDDWLYQGPKVEGQTRPFCYERVDFIFTKEQVLRMDNGQGLRVETYCGGYNCLHGWVFVNRNWEEIKNGRFRIAA